MTPQYQHGVNRPKDGVKKMAINVYKVVGPSVWASALINGDRSGLDSEECAQLDKWLQILPENWEIIGVEGEPWFTWSYALHGGNAEGGNICEYIAIEIVD